MALFIARGFLKPWVKASPDKLSFRDDIRVKQYLPWNFNRLLRESGYEAAFTNIFGSNKKGDDLFKLKRTGIDWNDTLFKFKMKLDGAYDWIDRI